MTALKYLLGGDFNEPPHSTGPHSPRWIADKTDGRIHAGARGNMGRIDFVISDAAVSPLTLHSTGGSDHNLRSFDVAHGRDFLRGAIWNAERDRDPVDVVQFLTAFLRVVRSDFVLLQEIQQYHAALSAISGYRLLALPGRGLNQNGILVRDRVKLEGFRVKRLAPWTWLTAGGVEHASPYMPHVGLNGWLRVGSVHEMSRIDWRDGRMVGPWDRRRIRRVSARRMVRWVELVRAGTWDQ